MFHALVTSTTSGPMKVRWNACYALGNAFMNATLTIPSEAITTITNVVRESSNFKTRINAVAALRCLSREQVNTLMSSIVQSLLAAIESVEDIQDFSAFKYKPTLTSQVCLRDTMHVF